MNATYTWYASLIKPIWSPPDWIFGPVWSVLYSIIFITFGLVFYRVAKSKIPRSVALPFFLNLISNFLFSPIQFGLQNNMLAALDISLVFATLVWAFNAIWPYSRRIVYLNIPYLAWVSFATVLQYCITILNWK